MRDLMANVLFGACVAATACLIVWGLALHAKQEKDPEPQPEPVAEVLEPQVWRGRVECVYGNSMEYSVDNLVDFVVSAQPGGWMWEMFREDGTVIFYQQPARTFCSAVPERSESNE